MSETEFYNPWELYSDPEEFPDCEAINRKLDDAYEQCKGQILGHVVTGMSIPEAVSVAEQEIMYPIMTMYDSYGTMDTEPRNHLFFKNAKFVKERFGVDYSEW